MKRYRLGYGHMEADPEGGHWVEYSRVKPLIDALRRFANAADHADQFMARVAQHSNAMECRDLYMWQAPRRLCMEDFKVAQKLVAESEDEHVD